MQEAQRQGFLEVAGRLLTVPENIENLKSLSDDEILLFSNTVDFEELLRSRASAERMRSCHRGAIQKCLCQVRDWATALGAVLEIGVTDRIGDGFDPAVPPEENRAYRFDLPVGGRSVPLNNTGEYLSSPYDFIRGITLEREELFDDVDRDRDL